MKRAGIVFALAASLAGRPGAGREVGPPAKSDIIQACDRVLFQLDDPGEHALGEQIAQSVCQALGRFETLFGRRLPGPIHLQMTADMVAWRAQGGRAWYIAAVLRADRVLLQPGRSLRKLQVPARPAVHELAHRFIRLAAGRGCPRWLDEGLAQHLSGDLSAGGGPKSRAELCALERRLLELDTDRQQRQQDYRAARALVGRLQARVGQAALIGALPRLRSAADPLSIRIAGHSLAWLLFETSEPVDAPGKR